MRILTILAALTLAISAGSAADAQKSIVLIAGKPSHGAGQHEHNAGVQLFARCLKENVPGVDVKVHLSAEWPSPEEMGKADTIVIYADGGTGHPAVQGDHLATLKKEMDRGCGFVCLHYAVEVEKEQAGAEFLDWLGGYFEKNWSVNPHWEASFKEFPKHPVANGVKPFASNDEWYFHMRFRPEMKGVVPVLSDLAPDSTMSRPNGTHSGNDAVREAVKNKEPQHVAWASERANGGRGFGFTGGHFHKGWGNDSQRKLALNAILWTAKMEVPANGVESKITEDDLKANLDPKPGQGLPEKKAAAAPAPAAPAAETATKPAFEKEISKASGLVPVKVPLNGSKELYLVIREGPDDINSDWTDWVEPTLVMKDGKRTSLTELKWKEAASGWGKVGINKNAGGEPLAIDGYKPEGGSVVGIGTHSNSLIAYDLPEGVESFEGKVALDVGGTKQNTGNKVVAMVFTSKPAAFKPATQAPAAKALGFAAAKEQMAGFKTPAGLQATLFAAEPQVQNPTNMEIDPQGRIWALECVNYRSSMKPWGLIRPEGDRVVILQDTNGDGESDKETTFYQSKELTNPLGICVLPQKKGTKVIVSASPNLWLLTDADGDDKAEKAEIMLKVGGNFDHDHNLHAVVFGPDGKFYFNFGNEGRELKHADGSPVKDLMGNVVSAQGTPYRQGMIFRCDIDLEQAKITNVETLAHNFRNNYEVCVDSFSGMWQSDNDDDGNKGVRINAILDYGSYGYTDEVTGAGWKSPRTNIETEIPLMHWHLNDPGTIPNLLQTGGGSPTGILINESPVLGKAFENQLIHCDAGPRTVRAYPVTIEGAGYKAEMVDILTSDDNWYRPADVSIAPDGSLFVADWYDPGVGGHNMGDNVAGSIRGRIYRVAPTGLAYKVQAPDFSTAEGCVEALKSPNNPTRYVAWTGLHAMGEKAAPALQKLASSKDKLFRARALHLLMHVNGKFESTLGVAMNDEDPAIRVMAAREGRLLAAAGKFPDRLIDAEQVIAMVKAETDKQVLREYALTLRVLKNLPSDQPSSSVNLGPVWAALAQKHDGKDRWYLEALGIGAMGRETEFFKAWLAAVGDKWDTPAGRDIIWRMRTPEVLDELVTVLTDKKAESAALPRYLRSFDFLPAGEAKDSALVKIVAAGTQNYDVTSDVLKRLGNTPMKDRPEVKAAMDTMLASAKGKPEMIEIVEDFKLSGQDDAVLEAALSDSKDPRSLRGIKLLLKSGEGRKLLSSSLASHTNADKLIALLGGTGDKQAVALLKEILLDAKQDTAARAGAVKGLSLSAPGAEALLELAGSKKFPDDMMANAGSALSMVQYPGISERAAKAFPSPMVAGGKTLPSIAELVKLKGDSVKGKAVFARAESTCILCHRAGDVGVDFAPGLGEIGSKLGKDLLYESIINPNAGVSMGFETWSIQMKDGQVAMGTIRSETNEQLVLAMPGGIANSYDKKQIASRQKLPSSMMPAGLQMLFSQQDLVDLVEYLAALKAAK